jgi:hypothetical protein
MPYTLVSATEAMYAARLTPLQVTFGYFTPGVAEIEHFQRSIVKPFLFLFLRTISESHFSQQFKLCIYNNATGSTVVPRNNL